MTTAMKNICLGKKFNSNHQLALILARHMGEDKARETASNNGWEGVIEALDEQTAMVTAHH